MGEVVHTRAQFLYELDCAQWKQRRLSAHEEKNGEQRYEPGQEGSERHPLHAMSIAAKLNADHGPRIADQTAALHLPPGQLAIVRRSTHRSCTTPAFASIRS